MSLRRKRVDFNTAFGLFKQNMVKMIDVTGTVSANDMHQVVYDICNAQPKPLDEKLFVAIGDYLMEYTGEVRKEIIKQDEIVSCYATYWRRYAIATMYLNEICQYLNGLITRQRKGVGVSEKRPYVGTSNYLRQDIQSLANQIWKDQIVMEIKKRRQNRLMNHIFDIIRQDRDGKEIQYGPVQEAISSLVALNSKTDQPLTLYVDEFETPFIARTKSFYSTESAVRLSSSSISEFMRSAMDRLTEENIRNSRYCHPTSHARIIHECETQYIKVHQERIHTEFEAMVARERTQDCAMAYNLLSRIENGITPLLAIYERYITTVGKEIIAGLGTTITKDPRDYVERLIELHSKYTQMCSKVFASDASFVAAVDKAFRTIVNDTSTNTAARAPEVMARYCDVMLKKKQKHGLTESEVDERLARVVILFKYIDDKDMFQKFYSRVLAKRLIFDASVSSEAEANMISRLKAVCGIEYTMKLQRMFTDMTISSDLNSGFKEWISANSVSIGVDFSVLILTAGSWPVNAQQTLEFQCPHELEKSVTNFTTYYDNRHSGRRLTWFWHWCKADVRASFSDKRYELSMSLYQYAVLNLFNDGDGFVLAEIREATKLPEGELKKVVKSLVDAGLLLVDGTGHQDENQWKLTHTTIRLNQGFYNKRTKVKISGAMSAESTAQETTATLKAVDEDRRLAIQATIVRIMKSRRAMMHNQLVQEVIELCKARFTPNVPMIKKCIEQLLDKQYIERAEDNVDRYLYVA
ncbi:hypothetical protein BGZ73_004121 [Actinomortierella ambigua]|nr:hypothetical protein BGZ73_004121 [Actinomortierella ambigua]